MLTDGRAAGEWSALDRDVRPRRERHHRAPEVYVAHVAPHLQRAARRLTPLSIPAQIAEVG